LIVIRATAHPDEIHPDDLDLLSQTIVSDDLRCISAF
jgi:hypothetical protein